MVAAKVERKAVQMEFQSAEWWDDKTVVKLGDKLEMKMVPKRVVLWVQWKALNLVYWMVGKMDELRVVQLAEMLVLSMAHLMVGLRGPHLAVQ